MAHRLSVCEDFVRRLLRTKTLAAIRLRGRWRVDPLDLQAFIDAHRVTPLPTSTDKFCCPCGAWKSRVIDSRPDRDGLRYLRQRRCTSCQQIFETAEEVVTGGGAGSERPQRQAENENGRQLAPVAHRLHKN